MIPENHAADTEIGFLTKAISKLYGRATAMPTAWELRPFLSYLLWIRPITSRIAAIIVAFKVKIMPSHIEVKSNCTVSQWLHDFLTRDQNLPNSDFWHVIEIYQKYPHFDQKFYAWKDHPIWFPKNFFTKFYFTLKILAPKVTS